MGEPMPMPVAKTMAELRAQIQERGSYIPARQGDEPVYWFVAMWEAKQLADLTPGDVAQAIMFGIGPYQTPESVAEWLETWDPDQDVDVEEWNRHLDELYGVR